MQFLKKLFEWFKGKGAEAPVTAAPPFKLIDFGEDQTSAIEILDGPYRGVVFRIGEVSFGDPESPVLHFKTEFLEKPKGFDEYDLLFTEVSGFILLALIDSNKDNFKHFLVG